MATDSQNKYSEQNILNKSYDETYHNLTVELLGENGGALHRVQTDANGNLIGSDKALTTPTSTAVTLTTANTAYKLPASELANRKTIELYNGSDTDIYIGDSTMTDITKGILFSPGEKKSYECASGLYAICASAGKIIRVLEFA